MEQNMFASSAPVKSERILYTPSSFAKTNLLYLQEIGSLKALAPHTSRREKLYSFLCFVVLDGCGQLTYGKKRYNANKGDVVFIDCREPYEHSIDNSSLWTLQWCHFYGAAMPAIYTKYCERGGAAVFHPEKAESYTALMTEIYEIAGSDDYIRDMRINEKLSSLLTLVMSQSWNPAAKSEDHNKKRDVKPIKAYIDEHYSEKLTLEMIAERFYINKYYLSRLFKEQYGFTLMSYLQLVRITQAKRLLRFTDKKIEEIGRECGMSDLTYFSRVFKKIEGLSPSRFRDLW